MGPALDLRVETAGVVLVSSYVVYVGFPFGCEEGVRIRNECGIPRERGGSRQASTGVLTAQPILYFW